MDDGGEDIQEGAEAELDGRELIEGRPGRRWRWILAGAAAGAAVATWAALVVPSSGDVPDGRTTEVATEASEETVEVAADLETTTSTTGIAAEPTPDTAAATTTTTVRSVRSVTTTTAPAATAPVCRNSKDPACGPFYWDPDPGPNQPLTASWVTEPPARWNTRDGRFPVEKLAYNYSDPDSFFIYEYLTINRPAVQRDCSNPEPQYGPWSPPHTGYSSAGTQVPGSGDVGLIPMEGIAEFRLALGTGACGYRDPYASHIVLTATVEMYYE